MIPATAHFVWIGAAPLRWCNFLSILSAAKQGGFEKIVLHHDHDLEKNIFWSRIKGLPKFESRPFSDPLVFAEKARMKKKSAFENLYKKSVFSSMASDLIRPLILISEGGVYLDLDTITVAPFDRLRASGGFFLGEEYSCESLSDQKHNLLFFSVSYMGLGQYGWIVWLT